MEKLTGKQIERIINWLNGYDHIKDTSLPVRFKEAFGREAISLQEKIVYIAHPVAGDIMGNIEKIMAIVRQINLSGKNVIPFAPYLQDLLALDDHKPDERAIGIRNSIAIIKSGIIDELWIYGPIISGGMRGEIELAYELDIPIILMDKETVVTPVEFKSIMNIGYD
jgi:hypothetical protein